MGVLPLVFNENESCEILGLDGSESFFITGIEHMEPRKVIQVKAVKKGGDDIIFNATARLDTGVDVDYFENNGILPYVLRKIMNTEDKTA